MANPSFNSTEFRCGLCVHLRASALHLSDIYRLLLAEFDLMTRGGSPGAANHLQFSIFSVAIRQGLPCRFSGHSVIFLRLDPRSLTLCVFQWNGLCSGNSSVQPGLKLGNPLGDWVRKAEFLFGGFERGASTQGFVLNPPRVPRRDPYVQTQLGIFSVSIAAPRMSAMINFSLKSRSDSATIVEHFT